MIENHTFQVSDFETTNTLDLVLTSCKERVLNILNKQVLGNIMRGHHVLSFDYCTCSKTVKTFDNRAFDYNKGNYVKINEKLKQINWNNLFGKKTVDKFYCLFTDIYKNPCKEFIP